MSKAIVVARYNENLDWLNQFKNFKIYIYNKGDFLKNQYKQLPNKGREGHTYFTHIVENYNHLDDVLFFSQGNPKDHVKDLSSVNFLTNNLKEYKSFTDVCCEFKDGDFISNRFSINWMEFKKRSEITPMILYEEIYKKPTPNCYVSPCAMFAVDKQTIKKHPVEVYRKLLSLYDRDDCIEMGYVLEYFWTFLFKENGLSESDVANCLKL